MRYGLIQRNDWLPNYFNGHLDRWLDEALERTTKTVSAPANIEENETHYFLTLDVPGFSRENIHVEVVDDQLKISGERKAEVKKDEKRLSHLSERSFGRFERTFAFGELANLDQIDAQFRDGVLEITVPKQEAAKPRRIEVKVN